LNEFKEFIDEREQDSLGRHKGRLVQIIEWFETNILVLKDHRWILLSDS